MATAYENLPGYLREMFTLSPGTAGTDAVIRFGRETWAAGYTEGYAVAQAGVPAVQGQSDNPYITQRCVATPAGHCLRPVADGYRMCPDHLAQYQELVRPV